MTTYQCTIAGCVSAAHKTCKKGCGLWLCVTHWATEHKNVCYDCTKNCAVLWSSGYNVCIFCFQKRLNQYRVLHRCQWPDCLEERCGPCYCSKHQTLDYVLFTGNK